MDCAREEYIKHLSGEVCAVRKEKIEVRPVRPAIQPLH
jgi:hypothetical protein